MNTLLEMPFDDAETNQCVSQILQQIEQRFCEVLQQARNLGELTSDKAPSRLALVDQRDFLPARV